MKATQELRVAPGFALPLDYATSTGGILAKKGAGKSNAAVTIAEKMYAAGVPWVAIDPKGDWWGIRSSADGKGPGLPIIVFGGRHGDIPLESTAGAFLADLVLAERVTCVLDVSEFSRAETRRFLLAFADRLYRQADAEPLHLFLEEAHEYLPQMVRGDDAPLVGAWQRIVKQGRFKGLGVTLISQRSAAVNKDVLTQVDTLMMMRTTSPQDRAAVKAWIDVHADSADVLAELPSLAAGEAWIWNPDGFGLKKATFYRRSTFDSGATPKVGEVRRAPATLADVDLGRIKDQMAETIEKAKADDPKELRKRIRNLEAEIGRVRAEFAAVKPAEPELVEVEVERLPVGALVAVRTVFEHAERTRDAMRSLVGIMEKYEESRDRSDVPRTRATSDAPRPLANTPAPDRPTERSDPPQRRVASREAVPRAPQGNADLSGPHRRVLTVLASYGARSKRQLAMQAGYSAKGGGFNNVLSQLRTNALITHGDPIKITEYGVAALGEYDELPTGEALLDHWCGVVGAPAAKLLRVIAGAEGPVTKEVLADATGYAPNGGGFNNLLSKLRTLGLITGSGLISLTDDFADSIQ